MDTNTTASELFKAGVNVKVDVPNSTFIWLGASIAIAGLLLILANAITKKL